MTEVDHVVYTTPCADAVERHAPARVATHELMFECEPADLDAHVREAVWEPYYEPYA